MHVFISPHANASEAALICAVCHIMHTTFGPPCTAGAQAAGYALASSWASRSRRGLQPVVSFSLREFRRLYAGSAQYGFRTRNTMRRHVQRLLLLPPKLGARKPPSPPMSRSCSRNSSRNTSALNPTSRRRPRRMLPCVCFSC